MNAQERAAASYGSTSAPVKSPRQIEYQAFARVTRAMNAAAEKDDTDPTAFPGLAEALFQNSKLWLIIASDVGKPTNGLPESLRAQLLSLAEFTRAHTGKVLAREATAEPLIEINTSIMRGLRKQSEAATCPA